MSKKPDFRQQSIAHKAFHDADKNRYDPPVKYGPAQGLFATNSELDRNATYQRAYREARKNR